MKDLLAGVTAQDYMVQGARIMKARFTCHTANLVQFCKLSSLTPSDPRERFGDWEGDTFEGKKGCGHLATHVERKSRFLVAAKLADKRAATMTRATTTSFWRLPKALRQTLTVDNGKEFSQFKELEAKTGLTVYFADPYAAWQRGTNENTNGILRHYYPKGFDFTTISDEDLEQVVKKINNRPRKCLDYRTPAEVMRQALRGALAI